MTEPGGILLKQQAGWKVEQLADGTFRWTTPTRRSYHTESPLPHLTGR